MQKVDIDGREYIYVKSQISEDDPIRVLDKKAIIGIPVTRTGDNGEDIVVGYVEDVTDDTILCKLTKFDFKPESISFEIKGVSK